MVKDIEKRIIGKMSAIKQGKITPQESKIGILFNNLKTRDEALYIELITRYKDVILEINK